VSIFTFTYIYNYGFFLFLFFADSVFVKYFQMVFSPRIKILSNKPIAFLCVRMYGFLYFLFNFIVLLGPKRRKGERGNSENVSALSAAAYTTTWLVMVTLSLPVAVSKQDF
jgi:hypothetical protein